MKHYACLRSEIADENGFALACIEESDIELVRQWRNAQLPVLRQSEPITRSQQAVYFQTHVWPELTADQPARILLMIFSDGVPIGYGGLVHIAWEHLRAEISVLMDPEIASDEDRYFTALRAFLDLIRRAAFGQLGLNRLHLETYATREKHIAALEEAGFAPEGCLREHVIIRGKPVDSYLHACLAKDFSLS